MTKTGFVVLLALAYLISGYLDRRDGEAFFPFHKEQQNGQAKKSN